MNTFERHLAAINSGSITKTTVIGLRKALNAKARRERGYSVSRSAPNIANLEAAKLFEALASKEPVVTGDLHASGLKVLQNPRYKKRLANVANIVANIKEFRLVTFHETKHVSLGATPVYRAVAPCGSFLFKNVPWQSGGNGPEIVQ